MSQCADFMLAFRERDTSLENKSTKRVRVTNRQVAATGQFAAWLGGVESGY